MKTFSRDINDESLNMTLVVYGTGAIGEIVFYGLKQWGRTPDYYCDHDPSENSFFGVKVINPDELKNKENLIVIVAFKDFLRSAVRILNDFNIENYYSVVDLIDLDFRDIALSAKAQEFLVRKGNYCDIVKSVQFDQHICIQHLEFIVTERCTLRCKHCSALVPYFYNPSNLDLMESSLAFDKMLEAVDKIIELSIIGGEPLLNKDIYKLINKYSSNKKISSVVIYTNGSIIPDDVTLKSVKKDNVWVHISDYGDLSTKKNELANLFENNGIKFFLRKYDLWQDAGDFSLRDYSTDMLEWMYSRCFKARCYSFYKSKLYCCVRSSNGAGAGMLKDEDCVDFSVDDNTLTFRKRIKQLMSKKYLNACKHCNGMIFGSSEVTPAIQMEKSNTNEDNSQRTNK